MRVDTRGMGCMVRLSPGTGRAGKSLLAFYPPRAATGTLLLVEDGPPLSAILAKWSTIRIIPASGYSGIQVNLPEARVIAKPQLLTEVLNLPGER